MRLYCVLIFVVSLLEFAFPLNDKIGTGKNGNLRFCVVEGKGSYRKAKQYCPILEKQEINIECVVGIDRTDCLRKISKGTADFGVFTSEDLVAAAWKDLDILITNELRFHPDNPFEYEIVAIVSKDSNIKSIEDLRGSRFCHPGYGYDADWTDVLANYFETRIIPRNCDEKMSLLENKLKASSEFFSGACKAGPWVADKRRDRILKTIYPNLCSQCYDSASCSNSDKYWGRKGPLFCITEESGDVAWVRLDDMKLHFGFVGNNPLSRPKDFMYLCPDGSTIPIDNTTTPCVWISKPWPVVGASRKVAAAVSKITSNLSHDVKNSWQSALLSLIQYYNSRLYELRPQSSINDYLKMSIGYQSANSYAECPSPRSISICTNSLIQRSKCDWLSEAAKPYGIEPHIQCVNPPASSSQTEENSCFSEVQKGNAEVAFGESDLEIIANKKYSLEPFLYEMTLIVKDLPVVVAVVKKNSTIKSFEDIRGKNVCIQKHGGVVWNSVVNYLKKNLDCSVEKAMSDFFREGCVPNLKGYPNLVSRCGSRKAYETTDGPLKCLMDGEADIAFLLLNDMKYEAYDYPDMKADSFRLLCPPETKNHCFISWSTLGQLYTRNNTSEVRRQELVNTFKKLDQIFGKYYKSMTSAIMMYGAFDHKNDVLFHDKTKFLYTYTEVSSQLMPFNYEVLMNENTYQSCRTSEAVFGTRISITTFVLTFMISVLKINI